MPVSSILASFRQQQDIPMTTSFQMHFISHRKIGMTFPETLSMAHLCMQVTPGEVPIGHRGKFSTMRTISQWNNHPREAVDSSTSDTFEIQLDRVLGQSCLDCALARKG